MINRTNTFPRINIYLPCYRDMIRIFWSYHDKGPERLSNHPCFQLNTFIHPITFWQNVGAVLLERKACRGYMVYINASEKLSTIIEAYKSVMYLYSFGVFTWSKCLKDFKTFHDVNFLKRVTLWNYFKLSNCPTISHNVDLYMIEHWYNVWSS